MFLHTVLTHFLCKFISLAYECTFISSNHIIYNIGYLKQTVEILMSSRYFFALKKRKMEFMKQKKTHKNMFNRWGIILHLKFYIV